MIPVRFEYEAASSVEQARELLRAGDEDAKVLAGGHSLIPAMKLRASRPSLLVDIGRLRGELAYVRDEGEQLAIGALTRHAELERDPLVQAHCAVLSHAAGMVGDPQVRHRGTIGGSLAHADPSGDLPAVIVALGAELTIVGDSGKRTVAADEFFRGVWETAIGRGELLTEIRVPKLGAASGWAYQKFTRRALDWAAVGVAVVLTRDNGSVRNPRIVLASMGGTPLRASAAEAAFTSADHAEAAAQVIAEGTEPSDDGFASAEFRGHLARVIGRRALEEALGRR
ncbi:MAG: xanthine dehydrogenase family protein subunit M [Actinobacteria bacterium]|nr:xanthine dehydrogenase family protein subunit M [Actinomycetota bacterium]MDQ3162394.1 xanthine dehydrogenase family protein subunit M [Actinomycetota bacterium]